VLNQDIRNHLSQGPLMTPYQMKLKLIKERVQQLRVDYPDWRIVFMHSLRTDIVHYPPLSNKYSLLSNLSEWPILVLNKNVR
jgi:hypothetical protein